MCFHELQGLNVLGGFYASVIIVDKCAKYSLSLLWCECCDSLIRMYMYNIVEVYLVKNYGKLVWS